MDSCTPALSVPAAQAAGKVGLPPEHVAPKSKIVDSDPHAHGVAALAWMRGTAQALGLGGEADEGPFFLARRLTDYLDRQRDAARSQGQDLEQALALLRQAVPEEGTADSAGWRRRWRVLLGRHPEPEAEGSPGKQAQRPGKRA